MVWHSSQCFVCSIAVRVLYKSIRTRVQVHGTPVQVRLIGWKVNDCMIERLTCILKGLGGIKGILKVIFQDGGSLIIGLTSFIVKTSNFVRISCILVQFTSVLEFLVLGRKPWLFAKFILSLLQKGISFALLLQCNGWHFGIWCCFRSFSVRFRFSDGGLRQWTVLRFAVLLSFDADDRIRFAICVCAVWA